MPIMIDSESGQVLREIDGGYKVVSVKSIETYKSTSPIEIGTFIKTNSDVLQYLYTKINTKLTLFLMSLVNYRDGYIRYKGKKQSRQQLIKLAKVNPRTFDREMKILLDEDVIHKINIDKKDYYLMNPYVCMRGKRVDNTLLEEFKTTKWQNIKEWVKENETNDTESKKKV